MPTRSQTPPKPTACLALADGTVFYGHGFGATGQTVAELVFNTSMTGYQEIMTDPSYAGQIVTFTFPHIGNVGTTAEDDETTDPVAAGMVVKWDPTEPSNWRATTDLHHWLCGNKIAQSFGHIAVKFDTDHGAETAALKRCFEQANEIFRFFFHFNIRIANNAERARTAHFVAREELADVKANRILQRYEPCFFCILIR